MPRFVASLIALTALSACGGASTGVPFVAGTNSYQATYAEGFRISELARALDTTPAAAAALQGRASYSGIIGIELAGVSTTIDRVDGDLSLDVNFADETLSGSANDFYSQLNGSVAGALTITEGVLAEDDVQKGMLAEFEGELELSRVMRDVSGLLIGEFRGGDARTLTGSVFGSYPITVTPGSALDGLNVDRITFEGGFVTERDATQ